MKIVIVGGGKVGELLSVDFSQAGHDVLLIDTSSRVLEQVMDHADISGLVGNGTSYDVMMEAGVAQADFFISVTRIDEVNMIAAIMAKKLGAKYTIARVRTPENYRSFSFFEENLGITMMINPELEAAKKIAAELEFPFAVNVDSFANNLVNVVSMPVEEDSRLVGMSLIDFRKRFHSLLVCIIERDRQALIPRGPDIIHAGDIITVTGTKRDLEKLYDALGERHERIKSCIIIGAGRITHYLLEMLQGTGVQVKVIEKEEEEANKLSFAYPVFTVIHADGSDKKVLDEEGVSRYAAMVSLTGIDEENVIISLYASTQGVEKTITKVNRTQILASLGEMGLQSIVTPKELIADRIIRFVRGVENSKGSNVETLHRLADGKVESLQFIVREGSKTVDIPIKRLSLKPNVTIAYIIRKGRPIFPGGDDEIRLFDRVIVVTTQLGFDDIDDILA
ncbi:MAG: Trk system potassium transporter TrkA [Tissierellia bacterium]|jgi:trk system potassium uptake protein TrkA|nr:Trk system potassium transporter TrkA [Bacillota bacterium]NLL23664.1 Trk system potassium transporter TrkA [Tissierellia bacterium]